LTIRNTYSVLEIINEGNMRKSLLLHEALSQISYSLVVILELNGVSEV